MADVDLVSSLVEHHGQGDYRWVDLWAADGGNFRMAVAKIDALNPRHHGEL
jgi:hypothetical protein